MHVTDQLPVFLFLFALIAFSFAAKSFFEALLQEFEQRL
jgi:hypothetical protein